MGRSNASLKKRIKDVIFFLNIQLITWNTALKQFHRTLEYVIGSVCSQALKIGFQSNTEELMKTIPLRETVAGEALSMLWGSKIILQLGDIGMRSPLAKVRVLLSSRTEFRFSIQIASTGPSKTIQICSFLKKMRDTHIQRYLPWPKIHIHVISENVLLDINNVIIWCSEKK